MESKDKKRRRMFPRQRTQSYQGFENSRTINIRNQFFTNHSDRGPGPVQVPRTSIRKPPSSPRSEKTSPMNVGRPYSRSERQTRKQDLNLRTRSGSLSSNASSSRGSRNSVLVPKFLPWAFGNDVTSRMFPLGIEEPPKQNVESSQNGNGNKKNGLPTINSDPEITRFRNNHNNEPLDNSNLEGLSVSSGSTAHNGSEHNTSANELHMDAIFNEFSPLNKHVVPQKPTGGSLHERSRSADYALGSFEGPARYGVKGSVSASVHPGAGKVGYLYGSADVYPRDKGDVDGNDDDLSFDDDYEGAEVSPFVVRNEGTNFTNRTIISALEDDIHSDPLDIFHSGAHRRRSWRHRVFLLLTDPMSSILSSLCFVMIAIMILCSNIALIIQTLDKFEYTPSKCDFCDNFEENLFQSGIPCRCPPLPHHYIVRIEDYIMYFFTVEWVLRVLCYDPPLQDGEIKKRNPLHLMFNYATEPLTILDLLAFLPYYFEDTSYASWVDNKMGGKEGMEKVTPMFRIFRVFQLVRLGQYTPTFCSLVNVLVAAIGSLGILMNVLIFSAAFFGSIIYWLERGDWMYTELTDPPGYAHVRLSLDGLTQELSPFRSIPGSFWWFIVTATTVGYGDVYPTSPAGKFIAALAMILGVLVIAFPVSVFSELWSKELKAVGAFESVKGSIIEKSVPENDGKTPPKVIAARVKTKLSETKEQHVFDNEARFSSTIIPNGFPRTNNVVMNLSDVQAIKKYISVIDDAQSKIKMLLEKIESEGTN